MTDPVYEAAQSRDPYETAYTQDHPQAGGSSEELRALEAKLDELLGGENRLEAENARLRADLDAATHFAIPCADDPDELVHVSQRGDGWVVYEVAETRTDPRFTDRDAALARAREIAGGAA
jgi:hypothetical protein